MRKKDKGELASSIIFLLLGSALLVGAWFLTEDTRRFVADSYVVEASIVSVESKREKDSDGDRITTYSPKVRFTSNTGSEIEKQGIWWSRHHYKRGEQNDRLVNLFGC